MKCWLCATIWRHIIQWVIYTMFCFLYLQYFLQGWYHKWAKSVKYESKLLGNVKKHKAAMELVTWTLDQDLKEKKIAEQAVPYSDSTFYQAAIEWLVATDQAWSTSLEYILSSNIITPSHYRLLSIQSSMRWSSFPHALQMVSRSQVERQYEQKSNQYLKTILRN